MSSSNCCFLTCIQISQEADQVVWYSHLFQNFPQFTVIHMVKGFGIVNKAEIDIFLELSCFFRSSKCWCFDLCFLCLFSNQLEHMEFHSSHIIEACCCCCCCCCCCVASVMSNSVRPQRRQPTRFPCPWDCPGKNTGVSCHFLLQCMKVKSESEVAVFATP